MKEKLYTTIKNTKEFYFHFIRLSGELYDKLWHKAKNIKWKDLQKYAETFLVGIIVILCTLTVLEYSNINSPIKVFVVQSGSMEPKILTGSLIFSFAKGNYVVGDIVSFERSGNAVITHRIIEEKETSEFITKGDANEDEDINTVRQSNIIGKVMFSVPLIGYLINFAKTFLGLTLLIIIPGTIIIYEEIKLLIKDIKLNFIR